MSEAVTREIPLAFPDGLTPTEAIVFGAWAAHERRSKGAADDDWSVTHVASGYSICESLDLDESAAINVAYQLDLRLPGATADEAIDNCEIVFEIAAEQGAPFPAWARAGDVERLKAQVAK